MRDRRLGLVLVLDGGRPAAALRRLAERLERPLEAAGVDVAEAMTAQSWTSNPDTLVDCKKLLQNYGPK